MSSKGFPIPNKTPSEAIANTTEDLGARKKAEQVQSKQASKCRGRSSATVQQRQQQQQQQQRQGSAESSQGLQNSRKREA
jgi:hypothetical protein